jgi:lipid II:glycine glycyltransferase (peptidoglycan interpeptide bridge formation enzyme)
MLKKSYNSEEAWKKIFEFLSSLAKENNCFMVRSMPLYRDNPALVNIYKKLDMIEAPIHNVDALISQYFDLSKSEEDLRHDMSSSTRNNVNKLLKNEDISVKVFKDNSAFEIFKDFHDQTVALKDYTDTPIKTLLTELQAQVDNDMCYMVVGYYKDKPISVWQCTVFGKYMHIYQAGSDTTFRQNNVRITYLLFWECLKLAKELGLEVLDLFGGMLPENYMGNRHPWKGVNGFKTSLGGSKITYLHPRDLPVKKAKYWLYYIYSTLRVLMKGYTTKW